MNRAVLFFLLASVIINSIVFWQVYGIVALIYWGVLVLSLSLNFAGTWYVIKSIGWMNKQESLLEGFVEHLNSYESHLGEISGMELYVGDPSIAGLLSHTTDFRKNLLQYAEIFQLEETADDGSPEEEA
jgi:hypothetical protein